MQKERKIQIIARTVSLQDAEKADDLYWANASAETRLQELFDLRRLAFGKLGKIQKVVFKRSVYETQNVEYKG